MMLICIYISNQNYRNLQVNEKQEIYSCLINYKVID